MIYSIDSFTFLGLESAAGPGGAPLLPHQMIELVQRGGVNGTGFVLLGSKGFAFPMRSWVDVSNDAAANVLMAGYRALIGQALYTVVHRSIDYESVHSVKYSVIGVTEDRKETVATLTGGLNVSAGSAGVILSAVWHLVPVEVSA